jgi:hypothetical protein
MLFALLAALACLLSAVSTFAMWEGVRAGHVASIGPMAGLGATGISGLLCILLASQHRWFKIVLLTLAVAVSAVVAAYVYVEPFRQWLMPRWRGRSDGANDGLYRQSAEGRPVAMVIGGCPTVELTAARGLPQRLAAATIEARH